MINRFLKSIHNFFLIFGINISFVRKPQNSHTALEHNTKEKMDEFFANPENLKNYINSERKEFFVSVVSLLKERSISANGKAIGDAGCGTGHLLLYLSREFTPSLMHGYDFSVEALKVAEKVLPQAKFTPFDIYQGTETTYDIVFCTEVLEHLLQPDKALHNLTAMLNPGGVLIITVPNGRLDTYEGHINFWSPESWEVFISGAGVQFKKETGLLGKTDLFAVLQK